MSNEGLIRGTHHLTFCVGGAQEDYDFHVRRSASSSVKKTVLFDGELPIYHLYYGNEVGDASTVLTAFPYRQAGWMGKRGTQPGQVDQPRPCPADSLGFWADRLAARASRSSEVERFGTQRLEFAHPCGIPYQMIGETGDGRPRALRGRRRPRRARDPRRLRHDHLRARARHRWTTSSRDGDGARAGRLRGRAPPVPVRDRATATAAILELVEEPDLPQGTWTSARARSTTTRSTSPRPRTSWRSRTTSSASASPTSPTSRTAATSSRLLPHARAARCSSSPTRTPQGFTSTRPPDELGTHMCIPPHWEDRRSEIAQLEPIDTEEVVVG